MKMKDIGLVFSLGLFLMLGVFLSSIPLVYSTGASAGVSLEIGESTPTIDGIGVAFSEDTEFCTTQPVDALWMNVSDANGWENIDLASCYINYTNGGTTYQAGTCVNVSNTTTSVNISCTGAVLNYTDTAGNWVITHYAVDDEANDVTNATATVNLTYNPGIHANVTNDTIAFGSLTAGTDDNENTNPAISIENCGNTILNINFTGQDITGAGTIDIGNFRIDNATDGSTANNMTLTTGSQQFTPFDSMAVGTSDAFYTYVDIDYGTPAGSYTTGDWTITPSEA